MADITGGMEFEIGGQRVKLDVSDDTPVNSWDLNGLELNMDTDGSGLNLGSIDSVVAYFYKTFNWDSPSDPSRIYWKYDDTFLRKKFLIDSALLKVGRFGYTLKDKRAFYLNRTALFETGRSYAKDDLIRYEGKLYKAKKAVPSEQNPADDNDNWEEVISYDLLRAKYPTAKRNVVLCEYDAESKVNLEFYDHNGAFKGTDADAPEHYKLQDVVDNGGLKTKEETTSAPATTEGVITPTSGAIKVTIGNAEVTAVSIVDNLVLDKAIGENAKLIIPAGELATNSNELRFEVGTASSVDGSKNIYASGTEVTVVKGDCGRVDSSIAEVAVSAADIRIIPPVLNTNAITNAITKLAEDLDVPAREYVPNNGDWENGYKNNYDEIAQTANEKGCKYNIFEFGPWGAVKHEPLAVGYDLDDDGGIVSFTIRNVPAGVVNNRFKRDGDGSFSASSGSSTSSVVSIKDYPNAGTLNADENVAINGIDPQYKGGLSKLIQELMDDIPIIHYLPVEHLFSAELWLMDLKLKFAKNAYSNDAKTDWYPYAIIDEAAGLDGNINIGTSFRKFFDKHVLKDYGDEAQISQIVKRLYTLDRYFASWDGNIISELKDIAGSELAENFNTSKQYLPGDYVKQGEKLDEKLYRAKPKIKQGEKLKPEPSDSDNWAKVTINPAEPSPNAKAALWLLGFRWEEVKNGNETQNVWRRKLAPVGLQKIINSVKSMVSADSYYRQTLGQAGFSPGKAIKHLHCRYNLLYYLLIGRTEDDIDLADLTKAELEQLKKALPRVTIAPNQTSNYGTKSLNNWADSVWPVISGEKKELLDWNREESYAEGTFAFVSLGGGKDSQQRIMKAKKDVGVGQAQLIDELGEFIPNGWQQHWQDTSKKYTNGDIIFYKGKFFLADKAGSTPSKLKSLWAPWADDNNCETQNIVIFVPDAIKKDPDTNKFDNYKTFIEAHRNNMHAIVKAKVDIALAEANGYDPSTVSNTSGTINGTSDPLLTKKASLITKPLKNETTDITIEGQTIYHPQAGDSKLPIYKPQFDPDGNYMITDEAKVEYYLGMLSLPEDNGKPMPESWQYDVKLKIAFPYARSSAGFPVAMKSFWLRLNTIPGATEEITVNRDTIPLELAKKVVRATPSAVVRGADHAMKTGSDGTPASKDQLDAIKTDDILYLENGSYLTGTAYAFTISDVEGSTHAITIEKFW
jgi:hypothetical protein